MSHLTALIIVYMLTSLLPGCATSMSALKGFNATSAAFAAVDAATSVAERAVDADNEDDLRTLISMKEHLLAASEYILSGYGLTNIDREYDALTQFACACDELSSVLYGLYKLGFPRSKLILSTQSYLTEALRGTKCSDES